MMIPSIKRILLFFTTNILIVVFFNILMFKNLDFITDVRFDNILGINTLKIGMLVSVFLLTSFILNLMFFTLFIKSDFKRTLLGTVRMSAGIFLTGIISAFIIVLVKGF